MADQAQQFAKYLEADIEGIRNEQNLARIEIERRKSPKIQMPVQATG